ncbi:MAG: hypothetical protein ABFC28_05415 [Rikenellaceae bacterium]
MDEIILNDHNKAEYPPMHSAEHILNQTMVRLFGCKRSISTHIERKKSKCDYFIDKKPIPDQIKEIENKVNYTINQNLPITISFVDRSEVPEEVDLSKLPEEASNTVRIVNIGDYDVCACIGSHVQNTSDIGKFKIFSI